ncbi:transketolase [Nitratireductor aestuarii]|uniref:Transketolase n=1 Tax=Nitratireductor aestuarii TaxID=1735103 RepID=A0A916S306_9HYPH|nr:transketolase [Nitratireductor aestuarii]GGA78782.1 transketolase [Nitratireductor aestuarii]
MSDWEDRRNLSVEYLADRAKFVRLETLRLTRIAGAGHYSSTFSCAELLSALYYGHLRIDPQNPTWPDRDRFILSKGHAAIGLYPILADLGFFPPTELDNFTRLGSAFGDHPDMKKITGIDFSSGSLGHGLSVAVGMALAGRITRRDYRTYCMLGDGELNEGQIWEAAMAAGQFKLQGLVAIVDRNQLSIDGPTEKVMSVEPIHERFAAFGWDVRRIDGHDLPTILQTLDDLKPAGRGKPQMIVADTIKGRGVKYMELSLDWHVGNLVGQDYDDAWAEIEAGLQPRNKENA